MTQHNTRAFIYRFILLSIFMACCRFGNGQTPSDAVMMDKGQICFDLSYNHDSWHEYWEGTKKRENGNIGTLTRHTIMPMFDLGITDRINVMGGFAYVLTRPSAGQIEGTEGFQNLNLEVKVNAFETELGPGKFNALVTVGFMTPLSNYVPDYAYSIGLGCTEVSLRPIIQYTLNNGLYARLQGAYNLRGNCILPRDYYYTTQAYFSNEVEMPDAIDYSATLGYQTTDKAFKAEIFYGGFNTLGGFDIRVQDMGFPSNEMDYTNIGAAVQYYPNFVKGLGVHVSGSYVLTGRNVGQSTTLGGGVSYFFALWNKDKN
ncbi:MAG: transporter [Chitinophagales bacterium]